MLPAKSVKVCPCASSRCFGVSLTRQEGVCVMTMRQRHYSGAPGSAKSKASPDASPWDGIVEDFKNSTVFTQASTVHVRTLKFRSMGRVEGSKPPHAISITQRDSQTLAAMLDVVFTGDSAAVSRSTTEFSQHSPAINPGLSRPRHIARPRWTSELDQELDRKKREMELCKTDLQLLEWATREVFGESHRYEEEAQHARENQESTAKASSSSQMLRARLLHSTYYSHLLAALMRTFRDKFMDPHLALSMFEHARSLTVGSFVYGCTTPAYNALVETRWQCFHDLRGVCDALEEMQVNGINMDSRTRLLAKGIRREVGPRTFWQEESSIGSGEVRELVCRLESLAMHQRTRYVDKHEEEREWADSCKWRSSDAETWKVKAKELSTRDIWSLPSWTGPLLGNKRTRRVVRIWT